MLNVKICLCYSFIADEGDDEENWYDEADDTWKRREVQQ